MVAIIWDRDTATANWFDCSEMFRIDLIFLQHLRGINMSQFLLTSIRLSFEVMLGMNLSSSGLRYVYVCEAENCQDSVHIQYGTLTCLV